MLIVINHHVLLREKNRIERIEKGSVERKVDEIGTEKGGDVDAVG